MEGIVMSQHILSFLLVFVGGGLGSMLRHLVNHLSTVVLGGNYPVGTVLVNISGSLAMGLVVGWFAFRDDGNHMTRLFLTTGILGGFTTFSAFSLDAVLLWERGEHLGSVIYVVGSVCVAVIGLVTGLAIIRAV